MEESKYKYFQKEIHLQLSENRVKNLKHDDRSNK